MKIHCVLTIMIIFCGCQSQAQHAKVNTGIGFGLHYGGTLGANVNYFPLKSIGVFGACGLYWYNTGYSFGAMVKLPSEKRIVPHVAGMWGTNAGLESEVEIVRKYYTGFSVGSGFELKSRRQNKTFWNFQVLIPIRDPQMQKDVDALRAQGLPVSFTNWPVVFSVGLHVNFWKEDFEQVF
jgi:hypothetical protein